MKLETNRYLTLLEQRLFLLQLLATGLRQSRKAFVNLDLNGIHQCVAEQESLCNQIRFLDQELNALQQQCGRGRDAVEPATDAGLLVGDDDAGLSPRLQQVFDSLSVAQTEVRHLNEVHAALLRRSRRSVNVLMNCLANYEATYSVPSATRNAQDHV